METSTDHRDDPENVLPEGENDQPRARREPRERAGNVRNRSRSRSNDSTRSGRSRREIQEDRENRREHINANVIVNRNLAIEENVNWERVDNENIGRTRATSSSSMITIDRLSQINNVDAGEITADERPPAVYSREPENLVNSTPILGGLGSLASRKRRLELQAAEERLKIRKTILAEQERASIELVNKRLELQLEELNDLEAGREQQDGTDRSTRQEIGRREHESSVRQIRDVRANDSGETSSMRELTQALTSALQFSQRAGAEDERVTHRLVSRLTSSRDLPSFDGDPIDWPRFKRAFESSTCRGGYTEEENAARLYQSLRKDAKDAVAALMITSCNATQIMEALELRFGNPDLVAQKVVKELRRLPKMNLGRGNLVTVATTVRNCVAALEAIKHIGYLHSPELATEILGKMSENLVHGYNRFFSESLSQHEPRLVVLAKFLVREADVACKAGTVELTSKSQRSEPVASTSRRTNEQRGYSYPRYERSLTTTEDAKESAQLGRATSSEGRNRCGFCRDTRHSITRCERFTGLTTRRRWQWAKERDTCFKCLGTGHRRAQCTAKGCSRPTCQRPHHELLHSDNAGGPPSTGAKNDRAQSTRSTSDSQTTANTWTSEKQRVLLQVLPVTLTGPRGSVNTYALLDGGSTVTLVDAEIAEKIGATGEKSPLHLEGANSMTSVDPTSARVDLLAIGDDNKRTHKIMGARSVRNLRLPCQTLNERDLKGHKHLEAVQVRCYSEASPTILIGQDHWHLITPIEVRGGELHAPVASRTRLGWSIHGYAPAATRQNYRRRRDECREVVNAITNREELLKEAQRSESEFTDATLAALVKSSLTLEGMGVTSFHRKNSEIQHAERIMADTTRRHGDRWETGLLWRNDHVVLPDSRPYAYHRLKTLERKMHKDPLYGETYTKQIKHFVDQGYAKKLENFEHADDKPVWYLPHFGVINENKPGKTRIVFDAAARVQGVSLNDHLLSGPDLLCSLPGIVMKFRQRKIAFTADIREMFLQVQIREKDRYAQLFLWRDGDTNRDAETYCMTSMIFGAKSSPASAQFVKNRNAEDFELKYPRAARAVKKNHYMDDYLDSVDTEDEAIQLIREVTEIHKNGGFELRGWKSNSQRVAAATDGEFHGGEDVPLTPKDCVGTRTLGLKWYPTDDTLSFALSTAKIPEDIRSGTTRPTKRQMLSVIMSVFDPLGFLAPYTVGSKVILQNVWRAGTGWDEQIGTALFDRWQLWIRKLADVSKCVIRRCYTLNSGVTSIELHVFCDASEQAMASVAYWRFRTNAGEVDVAFIASKTRVAPLKMLTIPRMELQAAVIACRVAKMITEEHDFRVTRRVFWTDSRVVWHWVRGNARSYKTWVANRLGEIDESTDTNEWRWIPTKLNPADDATRCMGAIPAPDSRWLRGPSFLREDELHWPQADENPIECTGEERTSAKVHLVAQHDPLPLPDLKRFSSWIRLIRATAWILLLPDKLLRKTASQPGTEHLAKAEILWAQQSQRESFMAEYLALKGGSPIGKESRLRELCPVLSNDDTVRVQGRISAVAEVNESTISPIILDGRHPYTRLLILRYHQTAGHGSPETVLNELRQKYWIVNARHAIRTVTTSCRWCRVQKAKPQIPRMAGLPEARMAHHYRPFTFSGVDYFGPMFITVGRRHEKRWGVLFTCLTTRAVHLEIAATLTTDSAIMAYRRFAARRGQPTAIYSDNGTNFRGAEAELRRAINELDTSQLHNEAANRGVKWHFIPPHAPHMGGSWERLVRCVKNALKATLKERFPKEEVLMTLFTEAEHSVNSRPLTRVSSDIRDAESLTPNHFLFGSSSGLSTLGRFVVADQTSAHRWRVSQRLADMFWSRWLREYLPTLIPRKRWNQETRQTRVGDVVLMVEPSTPRNVWPRGIVSRLFPGTDGRVRVVEVSCGGRTFQRPVAKIIPLEVVDEETEDVISRVGGEDVAARSGPERG